jgi:DNA-binding NarL/FixJ family response regulator
MNDLLWNTRLLGAMSEHAFLTEEEQIVLTDWAKGRSIANTAMMHHMSESTVNRIRRRLRQKYDSIQGYADLPPRK